MEWINKKTILVTGASSGIGKEVTDILIRQYGCNVIGIGQSEERLQRTKQSLTYLNERFDYYCFDISLEEEWNSLARTLQDKYGKLDLIVNCAGTMPVINRINMYSDELTTQCMKVNYNSITYMLRALLPLLRESNMYGFFNVISADAFMPILGNSIHGASQAARLSYAKSLIAEHGREMYVGYAVVGKTRTRYLRNQFGDRDLNVKKYFKKSPADVANNIVKAIQKQHVRVLIGGDTKRLYYLSKFFPNLSIKLYEIRMKHTKLRMFDNVK